MLYLLLITIGICVEYVGMFYLFPYLFSQKTYSLGKENIKSLIYIVCISLLSYFVYYLIPDGEFENRVLHGLSGGFVSIVACFFAAKDLQVFKQFSVNRIQYFVFSFLVVMFLGIVNEIAECFLQNVFGFIAAATINDTWFDLMSNLIGALTALVVTIPFIEAKKIDTNSNKIHA